METSETNNSEGTGYRLPLPNTISEESSEASTQAGLRQRFTSNKEKITSLTTPNEESVSTSTSTSTSTLASISETTPVTLITSTIETDSTADLSTVAPVLTSTLTPTPTTPLTTTQSFTDDNYKDDINHNGGGFYECNICFDTAVHPVLTLCGHLFCWTCLAQWLNAQSRNPTCPVCKAGCGEDKVIPIYGRGKEEKDPRSDPSIPTRPAGQRPPPIHDPNRPATSFFGQPFGSNAFNRGGMSISAGFGFFPLGVTFNIPTTGSSPNVQQSPQGAFMSRLFMMLLSLLIIAIIFA